MGEFAIGQGVSRFEDPRCPGGGRYVDDIKLPGMAYGVVLRSLHAHAKIGSIDTADAKAAPGVLAVLTSEDVNAAGSATFPFPMASGAAMANNAQTSLSDLGGDRVRWVGDSVAFVVAESVVQGLDAAERIRVDSCRCHR